MYPILFEIGPFTLYSLWLFVSLGFIVGTLLFLKQAKYQRLELTFLLNHTISLFLATILISRLTFFLTNWGYFGPLNIKLILKQMLFIWQPGYSFWGGVLGFGILFSYHVYREKEDIMTWIEASLKPLIIGMILGHTGQFLDGQGYGNETILPWGITITSTTVKYTVPIHPTQLYNILFLLFFLLGQKKLSEKFEILSDHRTWTLFVISTYGLLRFLTEFLRGDDTLILLKYVRIGHIGWLLAFVPAIILLYKRWRPSKK